MGNKPYRNSQYRIFVASHRCSVCGGNYGVVPHHHQEEGQGIMGGKVGDDRCVPLCFYCHNKYHSVGRSSFKRMYPWWNPERIINAMQREWRNKNGGG